MPLDLSLSIILKSITFVKVANARGTSIFRRVNKESLVATSQSDEQLWQKLKADDVPAFEALFERYYPQLLAYGNSLLPHLERVQDCAQNVFMDVWLYRQKLQDKVSVKAYLLASLRKRIARTNERDHFFRRSTALESVEFSLYFSIEDQLIADEETAAKVQLINQMLNDLPARQKEALYLRYHQELDIEQIAEILNINNQSVSNLLHRAIQHLRKEWAGNLVLLFSLWSSLIK